jgi:hypothetical protein
MIFAIGLLVIGVLLLLAGILDLKTKIIQGQAESSETNTIYRVVFSLVGAAAIIGGITKLAGLW